MKKIIIASLLGFALVLSASANLLNNGGFEDSSYTLNEWGSGAWDESNWFGWDAEFSDSTYGIAPHTGSSAVMLNTWSGGGGGGFEQKPAVSAGTKYDLSFFYATEQDGYNGLGGSLIWKNSGGDTISTDPFSVGAISTVSSWMQYEFNDIEAPSGAERVEVQITGSEWTSGGASYIDDVSLTAVPEPVSAALLGIGIGFVYLLRKKITK